MHRTCSMSHGYRIADGSSGSRPVVLRPSGPLPLRTPPRNQRRHALSVSTALEAHRALQEFSAIDSDGGDQQDQQSLDVSAGQALVDASSSFSDMTVDEPPKFEALGVDKLLASCLAESGIELPSPIQEAAIPTLLAGHNAAVQSYTGSGKTLAYLLPAMTLALRRAEATYRRQRAAAEAGARVLAEQDQYSVQVLVVAPSQELAMQICRVASSLLPEEGRSAVQQAIGGANIRRQAESMADKQPLVVVGTPGRLADLIRMGALRLHRCPVLILDEADQLLGDVYAEDMAHITSHCGKKLAAASAKGSHRKSSSSSKQSASSSDKAGSSGNGDSDELLLPTKRQTVLVSATLWAGVLQRFSQWCPDPMFLTMGNAPTWSLDDVNDYNDGLSNQDSAKTWGWGAKGWEGPASVVQQGPKTQGMVGGVEGSGLVPTLPPNLEHRYMLVNPQHKADAMRRAMYALGVSMGLGFMNWQQRLKDVAGKVAAKKIEVGQLHGDMSPLERATVIDLARKGAFQLLLVSDVAARGIDMPQVDVVFNIELPSNAAHYAHRAGRTGRMGAPGTVLTLVAPGERFVIERLSKKLAVPILECHLSAGQLVLGPPPVKAKNKQKPKVQQEQQQLQMSGSKQSAEQKQQPSSTNSTAKLPKSAAPAAKTAAAAAAAADSADDDGDYIIDEDDDVTVEGDEPVDEFKQRVKRELQAELAEIEAEKQEARKQRYQQKQQQESSSTEVKQKARSRLPGMPRPKGSPAEAAAMAIALIRADEKARKSKSKLPAAVLETLGDAEESVPKKKQQQQKQRSRLGQGQQGRPGGKQRSRAP